MAPQNGPGSIGGVTVTKDIEKNLFDMKCVVHRCNADLVDLVVWEEVGGSAGLKFPLFQFQLLDTIDSADSTAITVALAT